MSLGYAEKLSYREDLGGQLGAPECFDSPEEVDRKVSLLAELVRNSQKIVAFTGAGISTSCGIPDFRGPSGIWTLQRAGKPLPRPKVSFAVARPSFTHAALVSLMDSGKLTYIVSQNVDGLHLRSGVPRHKIAELHGNCFSERCSNPACKIEYIRDFEVETVGFKPTVRTCTSCGSDLHDHVLDWEDALPVDELEASEKHSREADLAICLGTSLQITPACNLPLKTIRKTKAKQEAGKLVIINLQRTQHDNKAEKSGGLVIRAKADDVMRLLMSKLATPVPPFIREVSVNVRHHFEKNKRKGAKIGTADGVNDALGTLKLAIYSRHGPECALPMIRSVSFHFKGRESPIECAEAPFEIEKEIASHEECIVKITMQLEEADGLDDVSMVYTGAKEALIELKDEDEGAAAAGVPSEHKGEQMWTFVSQIVHYHSTDDEQDDGREREGKKARLE